MRQFRWLENTAYRGAQSRLVDALLIRSSQSAFESSCRNGAICEALGVFGRQSSEGAGFEWVGSRAIDHEIDLRFCASQKAQALRYLDNPSSAAASSNHPQLTLFETRTREPTFRSS